MIHDKMRNEEDLIVHSMEYELSNSAKYFEKILDYLKDDMTGVYLNDT